MLTRKPNSNNNGMERARRFFAPYTPCQGPQYRKPSPMSLPLRNSQSTSETPQQDHIRGLDPSLSPLCSAFHSLDLSMDPDPVPFAIPHASKVKPKPKEIPVRSLSRTSGEFICSSKLPIPCTPLTKPKTYRSSSTGTPFSRTPSATTPAQLNGDLTHFSSIADWDPDDKFKDMGNLFDQFFQTVGKANTHHEGVKDALDLYKSRG